MRTLSLAVGCFLVGGAAVIGAFEVACPSIVERDLGARLDAAGYSGASFSVARVTLDRIQLRDVTLAEGISLGDVEVTPGPLALWRGAEATVTLTRPRVELSALHMPAATAMSGHSQLRRVNIVDADVGIGIDRVVVRGSIDLSRGEPRLDLVVNAPVLHVGSTVARNMAAVIQGPVSAVHVVASARVDRIETASGPTTVDDAVVHAEIDADLSRRTFAIRGLMVAREARVARVTVHQPQLPFFLAGSASNGLHLRSDAPLVLTARTATIAVGDALIPLDTPVLTARGMSVLGGVDLQLGSDDVPLSVSATVHDVPLDNVIAAATRGRAHATGTIDGSLVFMRGANGLELRSGDLSTPTSGALRIAGAATLLGDPAQPFAVQARLAAALGDFVYSRISLHVDRNPDAVLSIEGRGRKIPQALLVDVNVRGLLAQNEKQ
ncbi:MAG TPA: YdbH domain-containing protein [Kofleriaceae bacterium]|jgi:hypothetical protein